MRPDFDRIQAEEKFLRMIPSDQAEFLSGLSALERRSWLRLLASDDAADLVQWLAESEREGALSLLDEDTRRDVLALLAYREDEAGGLMNPRFLRVRPEITVDEAIRYVRIQAQKSRGEFYYIYVLDGAQKLLGVLSFRELFTADLGDKGADQRRIEQIMETRVITVREDMDQEEVSRIFDESDLVAIPVVNVGQEMKGVITADDVLDVMKTEVTEDIQKMGGTHPFRESYLKIKPLMMLRNRGVWLSLLFVGQMFTVSVIGIYQERIEQVVTLALFIPLVISSAGNAGTQATTLVIRAMTLGEVKIGDWRKVLIRELNVGLMIGLLLGTMGLARVWLWPGQKEGIGERYVGVGFTVSLAVFGAVLWGTALGAMLPFAMRKAGIDPATASTPFVSTLIDITGLWIYFSVAALMLF